MSHECRIGNRNYDLGVIICMTELPRLHLHKAILHIDLPKVMGRKHANNGDGKMLVNYVSGQQRTAVLGMYVDP